MPPRSRVAATTGAASGVLIGGGQRVQPADQQALALDLGMAERRALLAGGRRRVLVGVDVDERQHVLARKQRGAAGQLRQQSPVHLLQLQHITPGERRAGTTPAWRAPGSRRIARRIAPCRNTSMSSMLSAPAAIPATRHGTFTCAFTPHRRPGRTWPATRPAQPSLLCQRHHWHQARPRHQVRVIERRVCLRQVMQQSHLTGAPSNR